MARSYPIKKHKFFKLYEILTVKEKHEFRDLCGVNFISGGRDYSEILNNTEGMNNGLRERSLWNRLSELTRIIEDFFLLKKMKEDKEERNVQLLEIMHDKKINEIIETQFNHTIKVIEKQKISDRTLYDLQKAHFIYSAHQIQNNKFIKFAKHFRRHSEYAIAYFLTGIFSAQTEFDQQKLENLWHDYLANEMLINAMDKELIIESIKENVPDIFPHVKYAYLLYKAFNDPEKNEYFFESKKIFDELRPNLNENTLTMAYQTLINYCINRTNNFDTSFYRVLFDIYNEKLSMGIDEDIRKRNYPTNNFRDYVIVGLRLNEFEWVDNFIAKYGELLPEDYKPDEINICRAMLYLAENEYDNALNILEKTRRRNYLHYIDISDIKLRIYYIKNDMLNAYEEIERLDKYLKTNDSIPPQRRNTFELFVKNYKRLLRLRENFSPDRLAKAELYLKKSPRFFRKPWIEDQVKEITKKPRLN